MAGAATRMDHLDSCSVCCGMTVVTLALVGELTVMVIGKFMTAARTGVRCVTVDTESAVLTVGLVIDLTQCTIIDQGRQTVRAADITVCRLCKADKSTSTTSTVVTGLAAAASAGMESINIEAVSIAPL